MVEGTDDGVITAWAASGLSETARVVRLSACSSGGSASSFANYLKLGKCCTCFRNGGISHLLPSSVASPMYVVLAAHKATLSVW